MKRTMNKAQKRISKKCRAWVILAVLIAYSSVFQVLVVAESSVLKKVSDNMPIVKMDVNDSDKYMDALGYIAKGVKLYHKSVGYDGTGGDKIEYWDYGTVVDTAYKVKIDPYEFKITTGEGDYCDFAYKYKDNDGSSGWFNAVNDNEVDYIRKDDPKRLKTKDTRQTKHLRETWDSSEYAPLEENLFSGVTVYFAGGNSTYMTPDIGTADELICDKSGKPQLLRITYASGYPEDKDVNRIPMFYVRKDDPKIVEAATPRETTTLQETTAFTTTESTEKNALEEFVDKVSSAAESVKVETTVSTTNKTDDSEGSGFGGALFAFLVLGGVIGLPLLFYKDAAKIKKIYSIIITGNKRSLDEIAAVCGFDTRTTEKLINKAIKSANTNNLQVRMLRNAYIDHSKKTVVLTMDNQIYETNDAKETFTEKAANFIAGKEHVLKLKKQKTVTCNGCGAESTIIEGSTVYCKFCGKPLS